MNETDSIAIQKEKGTLSARSIMAVGYPFLVFDYKIIPERRGAERIWRSEAFTFITGFLPNKKG